MPEWLRILVSVVTSEEIMRPLIVIGIGYLGRMMQNDKKDRALQEITVDVVDFIEEHYVDWGIKGPAKMERFMRIFAEEFRRAMGRMPSERELAAAKLKAEAHVQRARRGDFRGGSIKDIKLTAVR